MCTSTGGRVGLMRPIANRVYIEYMQHGVVAHPVRFFAAISLIGKAVVLKTTSNRSDTMSQFESESQRFNPI